VYLTPSGQQFPPNLNDTRARHANKVTPGGSGDKR